MKRSLVTNDITKIDRIVQKLDENFAPCQHQFIGNLTVANQLRHKKKASP